MPTLYSSVILLSRFFLLLFLIPVTFSLNFTMNNYANSENTIMSYTGQYSTSADSFQIASNVDKSSSKSKEYVGRATYNHLMHLWDKKSRKLADFNTSFKFEISSEREPYGDGLVFFIAPADSRIPSNAGSFNGSLGLVNSSQTSSNSVDDEFRFVAVEFDTFQNAWDPPAPHVGINFNSVKSNKTSEWSNNVSLDDDNEATISYNSSNMTLSVVFTGHTRNISQKTLTPGYLSYVVDLRDQLPDYVIVGFSASVGDGFERHKVYNWTFTSTKIVDTEKERRALILRLTVGLLSGLVLVLTLVVCFHLWKKCREKASAKAAAAASSSDDPDLIDGPTMDDEFEKGSGPKKFSYTELVHSTNNFSENENLGEGGFGRVYRGFHAETNSYIAVKRLSRRSRQGLKEYASEVMIISKLRHKNLVKFIGWCHRKGDLLLVYEYMPNGSLDYHLFRRNLIPLSWEVRYKIAQGLASAIQYLHEEWEQCVLHRDIKSSNVMLDSSFNAKLGDFGLARLVDHEKGSQTTLVAGTMGYMAPECVITGRASKESDVYSFGVVLLEIASGRRPMELAKNQGNQQQFIARLIDRVWNLYGTGKLVDAADPKLCNDFDKKEMETLMIVGLWCVHPNSDNRPTIREANRVLNFEAPLPTLPNMEPQVMYYTPDEFTSTSSGTGPQISTDLHFTSLSSSKSFYGISPR